MAEEKEGRVEGRGETLSARTAKRAEARMSKARQIWCAYTVEDGAPPEFVLFGTEQNALRYAVEHRMGCKPVRLGVPLSEQLT